MAKFRQGDLVLQLSQRIIQGSNTILDANGSMEISSLAFSFGANISEFDTDTTLDSASDTRVPTQKAVKTYIDNSISNLNSDKIWKGDSYVQVIEDSSGSVSVVVDGNEVTNFNTPRNSVAIGKGRDSGKLTAEFYDTHVEMYINDSTSGFQNLFYLDSDIQYIGHYEKNCVYIDTLEGEVGIFAGNTHQNIAYFREDGFKLNSLNGATINEFSIDGTLTGNSDIAVPTEKAVKTYVDTSISNLNPDKIWEGDSYVEVVDDGTSPGYITVVADGAEVANFSDTFQILGVFDDDVIIIDQTSNVINVPDDQINVLSITEDGIKFTYGATVNEFSIDGTLSDNSDIAVPTEKAVRTYVDNAISSLNINKISEGDSYVEVVDSTGSGYVSIVTDGIEVAHFDAEATTQRIGKSSGAGKIEVADTHIIGVIGSSNVLNIEEYQQTLGTTNTQLHMETSEGASLTIKVDGDNRLVFDDYNSFFGKSWATSYIHIDTSSNSLTAQIGGNSVIYATDSMATFGYTNTHVSIDSGFNIKATVSSEDVLTIEEEGITLISGTRIDEFSTDGTLADDSDDAVPTEKAVKTYVDNHGAVWG